jgi:hypothetical protein
MITMTISVHCSIPAVGSGWHPMHQNISYLEFFWTRMACELSEGS